MTRGCLGWNKIGLEIPITENLTQPLGYVSSKSKFEEKLSAAIEQADAEVFSRKP